MDLNVHLDELGDDNTRKTQKYEQYRQRLKGILGCLFQTVAKGGDLKRRAAFLLANPSLFLPAQHVGPIHGHHIPAQLHDTKS